MSTEGEYSTVSGNKSGSSIAKLIIVVAVGVALVAALWFLPVKDYVLAALRWIDGLGFWGPFFMAVFYVVATVFLLPGSVITLSAGAIFGLTKGFATVWVGANLGACAAFLVGRNLARGWVERKVAGNPKFAAVEKAVTREGFKIILMLRLSPVFPFSLLNYALGLTSVSFSRYALATLIGIIPGGLMYVYIGSVAGSLAAVAAGETEGGSAAQILKWVGLAVTVVVTVLITRIAKRSLKAVEADSEAQKETSPS
ncbi:TVP38/TMEM64 family protein [Thermodesulfobacteriota bacterium]